MDPSVVLLVGGSRTTPVAFGRQVPWDPRVDPFGTRTSRRCVTRRSAESETRSTCFQSPRISSLVPRTRSTWCSRSRSGSRLSSGDTDVPTRRTVTLQWRVRAASSVVEARGCGSGWTPTRGTGTGPGPATVYVRRVVEGVSSGRVPDSPVPENGSLCLPQSPERMRWGRSGVGLVLRTPSLVPTPVLSALSSPPAWTHSRAYPAVYRSNRCACLGYRWRRSESPLRPVPGNQSFDNWSHRCRRSRNALRSPLSPTKRGPGFYVPFLRPSSAGSWSNRRQ